MNRQPQLEAQLRTLKLPGMADMLAERLAQARTGKLGHANYSPCSAATRSPAATRPSWPAAWLPPGSRPPPRSRTSTSATTPTSPPA